MRRPSIVFLNRVYPPVRGATGRILQDLARAMVRGGWHVTIITTGEKSGEDLDDGIRIIRVKGPEKPKNIASYLWISIKMFLRALRLSRRDVVVSMSDPPLAVVWGGMIAKMRGSRHINWCHDLYPDIMPSLGMKTPAFLMRLFKKLGRGGMKAADKVIVNGRCMAKHLAYDGLDARKIAMIPNWPDIELTDPEMLEIRGVPYSLPEDINVRPFEEQKKANSKFRVLYAGNLGRIHPIDTIIDAAEILQERDDPIEFVFVGDGAQFDRLVELRGKKSLDNVRVLPFQPLDKLREMLESGDVHLISMKEEAAGFAVPSKLYAALAVARPCILVGPEQSETAKVIHDFEVGAVVGQGDAQGLVSEITKLYEDQGAWIRAQAGALQARDVFTPQEAVKAWIERAWDVAHDDLSAESQKAAA